MTDSPTRTLSKPIPPTVGRIALAIMLGVATTVGIAWSLAWFVESDRLRKTEIATQLIPPTDGPRVDIAQAVRESGRATRVVRVSQHWADDGRQGDGSAKTLLEGTSFEAEMNRKFGIGGVQPAKWRGDGWPMLALSAEARWGWDDDPSVKVVGGMLIGTNQLRPFDNIRILPLQPIWRGLIFNFILFGLLWYGLFSVGVIRAMLRHRRGLCRRCGYKLQPEQERCSECGERVAAKNF